MYCPHRLFLRSGRNRLHQPRKARPRITRIPRISAKTLSRRPSRDGRVHISSYLWNGPLSRPSVYAGKMGNVWDVPGFGFRFQILNLVCIRSSEPGGSRRTMGLLRRCRWKVKALIQSRESPIASWWRCRTGLEPSCRSGARWVWLILSSTAPHTTSMRGGRKQRHRRIAKVWSSAWRMSWSAGLVDPGACWALGKTRVRKSGREASDSRARLAIQTHLGRIEVHRPLERIAGPEERSKAEQTRAWFRKEFLDALVD